MYEKGERFREVFGGFFGREVWLHPMNGSGLGKVGKQDQESVFLFKTVDGTYRPNYGSIRG